MMSRTARCDECHRIITLSLRSYAFRRHMRSPGVICPGSWDAPDVVSARKKARDAEKDIHQETTIQLEDQQ